VIIAKENFLSKILKTKTCWEWTGCISPQGYGVFSYWDKKSQRGVSKPAHRISWELFRNEIPKDLTIDHICRNRKCVNPDHLEPVSMKTNIRRGISPSAINFRKKKCIRGHVFQIRNNGYRDCSACHVIRKAKRRVQIKEYWKKYYNRNREELLRKKREYDRRERLLWT